MAMVSTLLGTGNAEKRNQNLEEPCWPRGPYRVECPVNVFEVSVSTGVYGLVISRLWEGRVDGSRMRGMLNF
jgi:hypothetical protein